MKLVLDYGRARPQGRPGRLIIAGVVALALSVGMLCYAVWLDDLGSAAFRDRRSSPFFVGSLIGIPGVKFIIQGWWRLRALNRRRGTKGAR